MTIALTHLVPDNFDQCVVSWQPRQPIDIHKARRQHQAYRRWLADQGLTVHCLEVNLAHPDGVFVEDTAIVTDEMAVITSMGAASRAAEPAGMAPVLARWRKLAHIHPPATIEGGDVLRMGQDIFVGQTARSNPAGIQALADILGPLGYRVRGVPVRGALHLKSGVTALDQGTVLVNPALVDPEPFAAYQRVETDPAEADAGNVLSLGRAVLANAAHPATNQRLRAAGYRVDELDISEFMKADAALTCPSIILNEE